MSVLFACIARFTWFGSGVLLLLLASPLRAADVLPTGLSLEQLEQYLQDSEQAVAGITDGAEKTVRWHQGRQKTPFAVLYIHGYSATRQEMHPLSDIIADALGANAYYTRLHGHGIDDARGEALDSSTRQDWQADTLEALAIGELIGERIIILSASTGSTLATWAELDGKTDKVAAQIMMGANFGVKRSSARWLRYPWLRSTFEFFFGKQTSWEPLNAAQAKYWTHKHGYDSVIQVIELVDEVMSEDFSVIQTPAQFLFSPDDDVVNVARIQEAFERFGSLQKQQVKVHGAMGTSQHIIAGDIVSPGTTDFVTTQILAFLDSVGIRAGRQSNQ